MFLQFLVQTYSNELFCSAHRQVKSCCAAPQVKKVSESAGEKSSAKVEGKRPADSDYKKSVAKKVKTLP